VKAERGRRGGSRGKDESWLSKTAEEWDVYSRQCRQKSHGPKAVGGGGGAASATEEKKKGESASATDHPVFEGSGPGRPTWLVGGVGWGLWPHKRTHRKQKTFNLF